MFDLYVGVVVGMYWGMFKLMDEFWEEFVLCFVVGLVVWGIDLKCFVVFCLGEWVIFCWEVVVLLV